MEEGASSSFPGNVLLHEQLHHIVFSLRLCIGKRTCSPGKPSTSHRHTDAGMLCVACDCVLCM